MTLLINILLGFYVFIAVLMILVILMQRPKSEGLGAAFGGGVTENIFGAQTTNVLTKITSWLATLFFLLTFGLSILYAHKSNTPSALRRELMKDLPQASPTPSPTPGVTPSASPTASPSPSSAGTPSAASPRPSPGGTPSTAGPSPSPAGTLSMASPQPSSTVGAVAPASSPVAPISSPVSSESPASSPEASATPPVPHRRRTRR